MKAMSKQVSAPAKAPAKAINLREFRRKSNTNQSKFWGRVGVTQSGGCRYETGRAMPKPTKMLFDLAYGKDPLKALAKLRGVSVADLVAGK